MLARVQSCALLGIDAYALAVEVDSTPGMQKVLMVGLPDAAVKESEPRLGSAIRNSGFRFPRGHVVINLAPTDMRKEGSALDLPIAVGMLAASDQLAGTRLGEYVIEGELALDGSLRPVAGALAMAILARDRGMKGIILPHENSEEAGVVQGVEVIAVSSLRDSVSFLAGESEIVRFITDVAQIVARAYDQTPDFNDVKGLAHIKRAQCVPAFALKAISTPYSSAYISYAIDRSFLGDISKPTLSPPCTKSRPGFGSKPRCADVAQRHSISPTISADSVTRRKQNISKWIQRLRKLQRT